MMKITNNLTSAEETFKPLATNTILLYVCGVTPYDYAHIGHGRCYVFFDLLYRTLSFLGYSVTYCRNFTDIDDKIIQKALLVYGSKERYADIANKYITHFQHDIALLNCIVPTHEPKVTENIPEIIDFIAGLIARKKAYIVNNDVYFSIASFPEYGQLSKQNIQDLRAGERVDINIYKKDPLDFALWKGEPDGEFWKSPWGWGRPGWHIECSALALKYLGKQIDIHGGGMDLMFPHHENEIAQSQALLDIPFAKYWVHNGFVCINKEKMSKSLGNFFTLQDVFKQYDPMVVRFYYLNHYYRAPLEFSFQDLDALEKSYRKLCRVFMVTCDKITSNEEMRQSVVVQKMLHFLLQDFNTPGMMGVIFENLEVIAQNEQEYCAVKTFIINVLGLALQPLPEQKIVVTDAIKSLIELREQARVQKDWVKADAIRDQLDQLGYKSSDKRMS